MNDMKAYNDYILKITEELIGIDSPGGFTTDAVKRAVEEFEALGCKATVTNKGGIVAEIGGEDENDALLIEAHLDTLGAVVSEIKGSGRLKIAPIGGVVPANVETENVRVHTMFDGIYEGTYQQSNASVHVNGEIRTQARTFDSMEIVLDELVSSKDDVKALGISVGDIVTFDPRFKVTEKGYIKSRYLDDKLSVGIIFGFIKYLRDNGITPKRKLYVHLTVYEEVGHGGSASVPAGVTEGLSVDMGCVGNGIECTERDVSICAKDAGGPYNHDVVKALVACAKRLLLSYAVDVYPHYGSDVEATLRGGNDIKHGLIGPGVYASHGYERSHVDAVENTLKLMLAYVGAM